MIREGVRYTLRRPDLMMILTIVFFAGTFGLNFQITSALMATEVFHKGAGEYGLLGTTLAIGSLSGALLAARRGRIRHRLRDRRRRALRAGARWSAGLMPSYAAFAVWTPVIGIASLTMITSANASFQMSVAPDDAGPRDGALHDGVHGRHPDRRADRGLGRPDLRARAGRWSAAGSPPCSARCSRSWSSAAPRA